MKKLIALTILVFSLSGCGTLVPKTVEFFQRKVKAVPELPEAAKETQRQAADYVATKTEETKVEAIATGAATNVVVSATEASLVADALSQSLGPPEDPWKKEAQRLALKLKEQQAIYNHKLEKFSDKVDKDVGKKIEGTGFFRIPYFVYIFGIVLIIFLAWTALKIYGSINPVVGIGTNIFGRIGSAARTRAMTELAEGGEAFKQYLSDSGIADSVKSHVLDLFSRAHKENQSRDTQKIIGTLTA